MAVEKLPSGKDRAVVRHAGLRGASGAVSTQAEAKMLEAKLKLAMGAMISPKDAHTVGEVVDGYITDAIARLSPGSIDFYRKGQAALPAPFSAREVSTVTPSVLDGLYAEMCAGGASEHKAQKVHRLLSASFNRAVRYSWLAATHVCKQPNPSRPAPRSSRQLRPRCGRSLQPRKRSMPTLRCASDWRRRRAHGAVSSLR